MRAAVVGLVVLGLFLSGCVSEDSSGKREKVSKGGTRAEAAEILGPVNGTGPLPVFTEPKVIDTLRAGGEPVITTTTKGTILIGAHPGYTHWHPSPTSVPPTSQELIVPTQGQSYMWRSTDAGKTFKSVSLLPVDLPNSGPRGVGQGVSDPDFAIDSAGRIYFTDLEALASASVSWSDDDGATWLMGNNFASGGFIDRQWLATHNKTVYFRGNGVNSMRRSDDGGMTWQNLPSAGCGGDIVAHPVSGKLYVGCGGGFSMSIDRGQTWKRFTTGTGYGGPIQNEPAIDAAGNVYIAADPGRKDIVVSVTTDDGLNWANISLKPFFPDLESGTLLWPWISAGSDGRFVVTFYGSPLPTAYNKLEAEWFVYNAIVLNATTGSPQVYASKLTPKPFHKGPMCQGGTGCQATTAVNANSDRRLGDFFENTIDKDGFVHVVYSDTQTKPTDTISHVGYVRLLDGPRLVDGPVPKGFPTMG